MVSWLRSLQRRWFSGETYIGIVEHLTGLISTSGSKQNQTSMVEAPIIKTHDWIWPKIKSCNRNVSENYTCGDWILSGCRKVSSWKWLLFSRLLFKCIFLWKVLNLAQHFIEICFLWLNWQEVSTDLGNGLVPSGTKLLHEAMLKKIKNAIYM